MQRFTENSPRINSSRNHCHENEVQNMPVIFDSSMLSQERLLHTPHPPLKNGNRLLYCTLKKLAFVLQINSNYHTCSYFLKFWHTLADFLRFWHTFSTFRPLSQVFANFLILSQVLEHFLNFQTTFSSFGTLQQTFSGFGTLFQLLDHFSCFSQLESIQILCQPSNIGFNRIGY